MQRDGAHPEGELRTQHAFTTHHANLQAWLALDGRHQRDEAILGKYT
jgi:hypothetical protein